MSNNGRKCSCCVIRDDFGTDISDVAEIVFVGKERDSVAAGCRQCGRSALACEGFRVRHASWCETKFRPVGLAVVDGVQVIGEAEEPAPTAVETSADLAQVARDVRRDHGNLHHDENDVVDAVVGGYLSESDAMNRDF